MKQIFAGLALVMSVTACQQKHTGKFSVSGKIAHAPAARLLLQELPFTGNTPITIDSASLDKNGRFALQATAKEEGLYRLSFENGPEMIFINDGDQLQANFDAADFRKPAVEGSPATTRLYAFFDNYRKKDSVLTKTFIKLDSLQKLPGNDSLARLLTQQRDQELTELNNVVKSFIQTDNSPAGVYYAIALGTKSIPPADLKPLAEKAAARFATHAGLAKLKSQLTVQANPEQKNNSYALLNQQAPDLTMPDANGKPVSISSFKGKYVLVDFWASWCSPCRQENPNVVAAYQKFKDKNFTILGISLDSDKAAWRAAVQKDKLSWTQISDLKQWESAAVNAYQIDGIPFNVLLDPSGKIVASSLRGAELERKLSEVLK